MGILDQRIHYCILPSIFTIPSLQRRALTLLSNYISTDVIRNAPLLFLLRLCILLSMPFYQQIASRSFT
jgi:hypothetical protein